MGFGPGFDVMPRSQQFTSSNWKQYDFSNRTFSSTTKKLNLSFLEISATGFPTRLAPIPTRFRANSGLIFFQQKFHILPELCPFRIYTAS